MCVLVLVLVLESVSRCNQMLCLCDCARILIDSFQHGGETTKL